MMKRKYDKRNKRNFIIIVILSVLIIGIFSLFIYKYSKASRIAYNVPAGSVIQDVIKNYIEVSDDAVLKIRWNGKYYLEYMGNKIDLGKKVMVYNAITGSLSLYGTFYEIDGDGKVYDNYDETILPNTSIPKFYKLDDREYLLVDTKIFSDDRKIDTNSYVFVELDKLGNAKLSNNKINLKTISATTLVTSAYSFDINNEILHYGKNNINLKKIIGSTNEYEEKEKKNNENNGTGGGGNGTGSGTGNGTGTGGGTGTGSGTGIGTGTGSGNVINNQDNGNTISKEEIMDKVKMTSIIRYVEGINQIDVDYVIYDPYNEYKSVYVEVVGNEKIETVYISKNDTHITLNNLVANTKYTLNFIYTTSDSDTGELIPNTFDTYEFTTLMPKYTVSIYKISKVTNTLTYKVTLEEGFSISEIETMLKFKYSVVDSETGEVSYEDAKLTDKIDINGNPKSVFGTFDIGDYNIDDDTTIKLTINSVTSSSGKISINDSYSFRFGR